MGRVAQYLRVLTTNVKPQTRLCAEHQHGRPPAAPHGRLSAATTAAGPGGRRSTPTRGSRPCNVEPDYMTVGDGQFFQDAPVGAAIAPIRPGPRDPGRTAVLLHHRRRRQELAVRATRGRRVAATRRARTRPGCATAWSSPRRGTTTSTRSSPRGTTSATPTSASPARWTPARRWKWWAHGGPAAVGNTCYELAFDPKTPGKIWGAFSNVHDIPNGNIIYGRHRDSGPGGVCVSTDFGATWKPARTRACPAAPATVGRGRPEEPAGQPHALRRRVRPGVYKSADDGKSWAKASDGPGLAAANMRVCRLQLHRDGTLFVAGHGDARRTAGSCPTASGSIAPSDGAETWETGQRRPAAALAEGLHRRSRRQPDHLRRRGRCRAARTQARPVAHHRRRRHLDAAAQKGPEHFGAYLHPKRPGWIYMTLTEGAPGAGLWLSKDDGKTWTAMDGLPFANAQRVGFDPADETSSTSRPSAAACGAARRSRDTRIGPCNVEDGNAQALAAAEIRSARRPTSTAWPRAAWCSCGRIPNAAAEQTKRIRRLLKTPIREQQFGPLLTWVRHASAVSRG